MDSNHHLCNRTLSNCSCFRSSSSSGLTPWQEILNTTGSGFSRIQHTTASSKNPGVLGYAHTVKSYEKINKKYWQSAQGSLYIQFFNWISCLAAMLEVVNTKTLNFRLAVYVSPNYCPILLVFVISKSRDSLRVKNILELVWKVYNYRISTICEREPNKANFRRTAH